MTVLRIVAMRYCGDTKHDITQSRAAIDRTGRRTRLVFSQNGKIFAERRTQNGAERRTPRPRNEDEKHSREVGI